jgi:hypothetical protein
MQDLQNNRNIKKQIKQKIKTNNNQKPKKNYIYNIIIIIKKPDIM